MEGEKKVTLDASKCQMKEMLTLYGLMNKLFYESCHLFLFLILSMIRLMFNIFLFCFMFVSFKRSFFAHSLFFLISCFFHYLFKRVYTWSTFIISIFEVEKKELSNVLDDWVFH